MTEEKKLTREQRRVIERIESEATQYHNSLASKFIDYLLNSDNPIEESLKEKVSNLSVQWKMYVKRKGLKDTALNLVNNYCHKAIDQFNELKNQKVKPNPDTVMEAAEQDKLI
jgi:hypothetical protein